MTARLEAIQTAISLVSALLYIFVGVMTGRRRVHADARLALRAWQSWWIGLGVASLLANALRPWQQGNTSEALYLAYILPLILVVVGVVAALVYYLLYLYTGNRRVLQWTALYFGALTIFYVLLFLGTFSPDGYPRLEDVDGTNTYLLGPEGDVARTFSLVAGILLVVPLLASAIAYALLYFRLEGATERYRIAMVSGAFVAWFGSSLLNTLLTNALDDVPDGWPIVTRSIALVAATMVLAAYYPPQAWQKRYGLRSLHDEA